MPETQITTPEGFTPGPWVYAKGISLGRNYRVKSAHEEYPIFICGVCQLDPQGRLSAEQTLANARLIAMAPEMAAEIVRLRSLLAA